MTITIIMKVRISPRMTIEAFKKTLAGMMLESKIIQDWTFHHVQESFKENVRHYPE